MNIILNSDRRTDVTVHFRFVDGANFSTNIRLNGYGPAEYAVTGRWPNDLVELHLEYDGVRHSVPIEPEGNGHLKPMHVYGGRDKWSQLLRNKALGLDEGEDEEENE